MANTPSYDPHHVNSTLTALARAGLNTKLSTKKSNFKGKKVCLGLYWNVNDLGRCNWVTTRNNKIASHISHFNFRVCSRVTQDVVSKLSVGKNYPQQIIFSSRGFMIIRFWITTARNRGVGGGGRGVKIRLFFSASNWTELKYIY